ncbi:MAG: 16S rRNA (cytosine(1402)-N(4))-methyltransferase RsmH [marine benthic group bacterium]|nr:16S rRNA (cytosine(1402)-N(4))-methyltransferase RsmH [Gemmatimonadota bacterium]MCL7990904.1 16S rRNA (cytosine(1402)-N(4))-methyltransferase RsmH [Gemmatimonadota bacterium]
MVADDFSHEPVLAEEVLELLEPGRGGTFLDATIGGAGHAERILESDPTVRLIGLDRDPDALAAAARRLGVRGDRASLIRGNFRNAPELVAELSSEGDLAGALLDLGVSSHQIDTTARGFSFRRGTPLNMRMGGTTGGGRTAAEILNTESEERLGILFRDYGEERRWRAMAREIVRRRSTAPFRTADDLVGVFTAVLGPGLDASTKARLFQALRIEVNDEMTALQEALIAIRGLLASGGRFVVIAYHSLEDRIVKNAFRDWSRECVCPPQLPVCRCRGVALGHLLTRKPVRPRQAEVERNPRARSARLRAWEKA